MRPSNRLRLEVEESGLTLLLTLTGDFDLAGVGAVEIALDRLSLTPALQRVVFDLRGLTYLGETGLRTILRAEGRGRAQGTEVVVVRPRGAINRVFTLTRAGHQLTMADEPPPPKSPDLTPGRASA
jgi:anti-anti-sigma factor